MIRREEFVLVPIGAMADVEREESHEDEGSEERHQHETHC